MPGAGVDVFPSVTTLHILRGLVLLALMAGFMGIWIWAWKRERKPEFRDASLLPLEDDEAALSGSHGMKENARE
jgi:cbb3-type cytochrome oxidase subunit 3